MSGADAVVTQWPCRLPADLDDALRDIQIIMRASKSSAVRYVIQLGIESWAIRQREAEKLERMAADGMTIEAILPYLGSRLRDQAGRYLGPPGSQK